MIASGPRACNYESQVPHFDSAICNSGPRILLSIFIGHVNCLGFEHVPSRLKGTEISLFLTSLYGTRDPILYAPANKPIKIASRKHYKDMNLLSQTPRKSGECDNVTFSINLVYKNLARSSNALWVLWGASGVILCISGTAQSTFCTKRNSLGSLQHSSNTIWVPILSQMATFGHQIWL